MIIKRAFSYTYTIGTEDKVSVTSPVSGSTSTITHYLRQAEGFWAGLKGVLDEFGVSGSYDINTGEAIIDGAKIYLFCCGNTLRICDNVNSYSMSWTYTGYSSYCGQDIGITIKGTKNSWAIYLGSGSSVGSENFMFAVLGFKRFSDNKIVKGVMFGNYDLFSPTEDGNWLERQSILTNSKSSSSASPTYEGFALVPAVVTGMGGIIVDAYLLCAGFLEKNSYYTLGSIPVVNVLDKLLLAI